MKENNQGVWGPPPENFQILHLAGQDFQHVLKRISLEIAVFLGFFRNKLEIRQFPSHFLQSSEISFKFPYNFLQLVKISFKKEISLKMEALSVCIIIVFPLFKIEISFKFPPNLE
jgi:hypothetical protein